MKDSILNQQEPRSVAPEEVEPPTADELIDELIRQRHGDARNAVAWCLGYIAAAETHHDRNPINTLKHRLSEKVKERKATSNNPKRCLRCSELMDNKKNWLCPACKQAIKEEKELCYPLFGEKVKSG